MDDIPENVITALAEARRAGTYNMLNRHGVTDMVGMIDEEAGDWLIGNGDRYMDALNAMGQFITDHPDYQ